MGSQLNVVLHCTVVSKHQSEEPTSKRSSDFVRGPHQRFVFGFADGNRQFDVPMALALFIHGAARLRPDVPVHWVRGTAALARFHGSNYIVVMRA